MPSENVLAIVSRALASPVRSKTLQAQTGPHRIGLSAMSSPLHHLTSTSCRRTGASATQPTSGLALPERPVGASPLPILPALGRRRTDCGRPAGRGTAELLPTSGRGRASSVSLRERQTPPRRRQPPPSESKAAANATTRSRSCAAASGCVTYASPVTRVWSRWACWAKSKASRRGVRSACG